MLIDRKKFDEQRPWFVTALALAIGSIVWYVLASLGRSKLPGGSSPPGFTFGVVGGLVILFEFALWPRKKLRSWRIGRVKTWMAAHIWFGLLTVPLLILHSGFRWGGSLSTVLMVLFLVVIASGVWGLVLQQSIPSKMLNQVQAETIHSQIDRMIGFMVDDASRLVAATCGPLPGEDAHEATAEEVEQGMPLSYLTVGKVQTVGDVQGKVLMTRVPQAPVPDSEPLREIFNNSIKPYLVDGKRSGSQLALANKAEAIFRELRNRLSPGTYETILSLENLCVQRRQLDRQRDLHWWLHNWICVHLPLSVALVILMIVHVWVALKYR